MTEELKKLLQEAGREQIYIYYKLLDFFGFVITTIGVVAGFGFTALEKVKNVILFVIGETCLFVAIGIGIYLILRNLIFNLENLKKLRQDIKENGEAPATKEEKVSYKKIYCILIFWFLGGMFILLSLLDFSKSNNAVENYKIPEKILRVR